MTDSTRTPSGATTSLTPIEALREEVRSSREMAVDVLRAWIAPALNISNKTVVDLARVMLKSSVNPAKVFPGVAELVRLIETLDQAQAEPSDVLATYPADYEKRAHAKLAFLEAERAKRSMPRIVE